MPSRIVIGYHRIALLFYGILLIFPAGCGRPAVRPAAPLPSPQGQVGEKKVLPRLGYTIQAGAFGNPENAARLTHSLQ